MGNAKYQTMLANARKRLDSAEFALDTWDHRNYRSESETVAAYRITFAEYLDAHDNYYFLRGIEDMLVDVMYTEVA